MTKIEKKIIDKRIELFKTATDYFIKYFGMFGWEITVAEDSDEVHGSCTWEAVVRRATIAWGKEWISQVGLSDYEIVKIAFHECAELFCHVFYDPMERFYAEDYCQEIGHIVIRFLENKMFPLIYPEFVEKCLTVN